MFRFIAAERANHPVSLMCRVLGVSRQGFHAFERRGPSRRAVDDAVLERRIAEVHRRSRSTYRSPRVHAELRHEGIRVGRKRVDHLMRQHGLTGLVKRPEGPHHDPCAGRPSRPRPGPARVSTRGTDRLWVADITYVRTWEGFLCLAVVVDCFSRRCVGWAMRDDLGAELVVEALEMAVWRRRPKTGLVHHSGQGSQYVSLAFSQRCRGAGIAQSMGAKGCALDNAVCESFIGTLKKEFVHRRSWPTRREAQTAVFEWIESFYDRQRRHSTLGFLSPDHFENISLYLPGKEAA